MFNRLRLADIRALTISVRRSRVKKLNDSRRLIQRRRLSAAGRRLELNTVDKIDYKYDRDERIAAKCCPFFRRASGADLRKLIGDCAAFR